VFMGIHYRNLVLLWYFISSFEYRGEKRTRTKATRRLGVSLFPMVSSRFSSVHNKNEYFGATAARSCQAENKLKLFLKKESTAIFLFKMRSIAGFRAVGRLLKPAPTKISL